MINLEDGKHVCPICLKMHEDKNKYNICHNCAKKIIGFNPNKKINKVHCCEEHGFYIGHNGNKTECPKCIREKRNSTCEKCGGSFVYSGSHLERENRILICDSCKKKIPGYGKNKNLTKCNKCGSHSFRKHSISSCLVCGHIPANDSLIDRILEKENYSSEASRKFKKDISKITVLRKKSALYDCDILIYPQKEEGVYSPKTCPGCGRSFYPHSPQTKFCQACFPILRCNHCSEEFTTSWTKFLDKNKENSDNVFSFCDQKCRAKYWSVINDNLKDFRESWRSIDSSDESLINHFSDIVDIKNSEAFEIVLENYIEINDENIEEFQVQGVWFNTDSKGNVLDVHQANSIMNEYITFKKKINNPKIEKYIEMSKIKNEIKCFFLMSGNLVERFNSEMHFAIKSKAKYWKPAPGYQCEMLRKLNFKEEI